MTVDPHATFEELVAILSQGIGQRHLYFAEHPRVQAYARDFVTMLNELLHKDQSEQFFLGLVEGNLVHNGLILVGPTILGLRVIELLQKLDSGGILFRGGLDADEILGIFEFATELSRDVPPLPQVGEILRKRNITNIEFSPAYEDPAWFGQFLFGGVDSFDNATGAATNLENPDIVPVYQGLFDSVQGAHGLAEANSSIEIDDVRTVSEKLVQSSQGGFTDVMQLVRYPDYDSFTVGHSVRVAMIAVVVAHKAGLPDSFLVELGTAGLLHDVGKAEVPTEILYKPARLDDDERAIVAKHPVAGAQILLENQNAGPMAIAAAWGHHLRYDGGGYPEMAKWGFNSQITSLLTVCDVFEAITAVRPYKTALTPRRAYEIMVRDTGAFDPTAFAALVSAMGLYPPGSSVSLSNGAGGVVLAAGTDIAAPIVRVTHQQGFGIPTEEQQVLDLSAKATDVHVVELMDPTGSRDSLVDEDEAHAATPVESLLCNHDHPSDRDASRLFGGRR
jgi:HD-GYP domain-containing protein (c-di-GMP phosphodiesterase class II)